MKTLLLTLAIAWPGGPFEDGLKHYSAGRYLEAVVSFKKALEDDPDNARLNYNLALALWRSGEFDAAETAAEKAAALSKGSFDARRDGILGSLRYDEARKIADQKPAPQPVAPAPGAPNGAAPGMAPQGPDLQKALDLTGKARSYFQSSALANAKAGDRDSAAVMLRNLERAIRFEEELKKRIEEQKKQQDDKNKDDKNKDDKNKDDKNKDDQKKDPKKDDQKQDEKKDDEKKSEDKSEKKDEQNEPKPKDDEKKKEPDPKQDEQKKDEKGQKPEDEKDEQKAQKPPKPQQVPGEHDPNKELSPEEKRQLLKKLQQFEKNLQKLKAARRAARPKVKKDW